MNTVKTIETNENGVTWYEINGVDFGTGFEFENETVGVTDCGRILDCDGCPVTAGDGLEVAIRNMLNL